MAADYVTRVRNYTPRPNGEADETRKELSREGYKAFGMIYEKRRTERKNRTCPSASPNAGIWGSTAYS